MTPPRSVMLQGSAAIQRWVQQQRQQEADAFFEPLAETARRNAAELARRAAVTSNGVFVESSEPEVLMEAPAAVPEAPKTAARAADYAQPGQSTGGEQNFFELSSGTAPKPLDYAPQKRGTFSQLGTGTDESSMKPAKPSGKAKKKNNVRRSERSGSKAPIRTEVSSSKKARGKSKTRKG